MSMKKHTFFLIYVASIIVVDFASWIALQHSRWVDVDLSMLFPNGIETMYALPDMPHAFIIPLLSTAIIGTLLIGAILYVYSCNSKQAINVSRLFVLQSVRLVLLGVILYIQWYFVKDSGVFIKDISTILVRLRWTFWIYSFASGVMLFLILEYTEKLKDRKQR